MDKLPTELIIKITDHLFTSGRHSDQVQRQAQLAALVLTCKRLCQVVTPIFYESPFLLTAKQAEKYLRTFTGSITPFSLAERTTLTLVPPCKLSFHFYSYSTERLPHLDLFFKCGNFSRITSLHFTGCWDQSHFVPRVLSPFSPLRLQLRSLNLCTTIDEDPPAKYRRQVRSDDFALSFILEAALYLHPVDAFRLCPVTTAEAIFPTRNFHISTQDREMEDLDSPEMEPWGDEDLENPSPEFLFNCRVDFDFFVSHFEYDYEEDWRRVPLASIGNFQEPHSDPAPFSRLANLSLCIASTTHLLLILKTVTFSSAKNLTLYGRVIQVADNHITLLRLAFTNYEGKHGFCYGTDPEKITLDDNAFISETNAFLVENDNNDDDLLYDDDNTWPPLEKQELEVFGVDWRGPRLGMLDLRDLWLLVK